MRRFEEKRAFCFLIDASKGPEPQEHAAREGEVEGQRVRAQQQDQSGGAPALQAVGQRHLQGPDRGYYVGDEARDSHFHPRPRVQL